jgi:thiosulfate/3-mercaptopyruvate sulfurtransferase
MKDGAEYATFLSEPELKKALVDAVGADRTNSIVQGLTPVVTSCGSGMTAAVLWLGLKLLGVQKIGLYDEVSGSLATLTNTLLTFYQSWTGYAMRPSSKIEKEG